MKTKPLNGIGPGDKGPTDYLKERAELRRIAQASRKPEQMREDCHCVMPGFAFFDDPLAEYQVNRYAYPDDASYEAAKAAVEEVRQKIKRARAIPSNESSDGG